MTTKKWPLFMLTSLALCSWVALPKPPDFEVKIVRYPSKIRRAIPVEFTAEVRNISGRPITIARGHPGFTIRFQVGRADGKPIETIKRPQAEFSAGYAVETLPAGWFTRKREGFSGDHEPGVWWVVASVSSHGPYIPRKNGRLLEEIEAWEGEVLSEPVSVEIVQPTGEDLDAYRAYLDPRQPPEFRFARQLREFPTSSYAAHIVYKESLGFAGSDPSLALRAMETGSFLGHRPVPDHTQRRGWRTLSPEEGVLWREKWYSLVLTHHPDIWFADEMRLRLALDQLAIKNTEQATTLLQALAEGAKGRVQKRAGQYLAIMINRGMIKPSAIPAKLRAKLPPVEAAKKPAAVKK